MVSVCRVRTFSGVDFQNEKKVTIRYIYTIREQINTFRALCYPRYSGIRRRRVRARDFIRYERRRNHPAANVSQSIERFEGCGALIVLTSASGKTCTRTGNVKTVAGSCGATSHPHGRPNPGTRINKCARPSSLLVHVSRSSVFRLGSGFPSNACARFLRLSRTQANDRFAVSTRRRPSAQETDGEGRGAAAAAAADGERE